MITKETFIKTMEQLENLDEKFDNINDAFEHLNGEFCSFYTFEPFDIALNLLEEAMNDKEHWISYFVWECNWLKDLEYSDVVVTANGAPVDLSDRGKVYDFLMESKYND